LFQVRRYRGLALTKGRSAVPLDGGSISSALGGLVGGVATPEQATDLAMVLESRFCPDPDTQAGALRCAPSLEATSPHFTQKRYWRGPVWVNTNWLLLRAVQRYYPQHPLLSTVADRARTTILNAVEQDASPPRPFSEYFDPFSLAPYGSDRFSWTAALYVDVVESL
jgi:hypothetical protein